MTIRPPRTSRLLCESLPILDSSSDDSTQRMVVCDTKQGVDHTDGPLEVKHYQLVFTVLEECDRARTLSGFREVLLESLMRHFQVGSTTFFSGSTQQQVFHDPDAILTGITRGLLDEYRERWYTTDIFASADTIRALHRTNVASLQELTRLSPDSSEYVRNWLYRSDLRSATAVALNLPKGRKAMIGLFDHDPQRLGPAELEALRLLSRPLSRIASALPDFDEDGGPVCVLSPRHAEVAQLIGQGLTNRAIADLLFLNEDSVKKYVSRILATTGCRNRTELALRVRAGEF